MEEAMNLSSLLEALEYGQKYKIRIYQFQKWTHEKTVLQVQHVNHTTPFCCGAKQTPRDLRWCMLCRSLVQAKAERTKQPFSGYCVHGVYEYNYPIIVKGHVYGVVSVGNIISDVEVFCRKNGIPLSDPILQTMQIGCDAAHYEKIARIVDSYIQMLWTQYPQSIRPEKENPTIQLLRDYMEHYFTQEISLSMLAKSYHYNEKYLGRLFKKQMGMAFHEYLNEKRLEHARKLLQDGQQTVIDIALQSGFNSVTYFNRMFKQRYGITPTAYRSKNNWPLSK